MMRRSIALIALTSLVFAACGGGDVSDTSLASDPPGQEAPDTSSPEGESPPETEAPSPEGSAEAIAPVVDVNACSVVSQTDLEELGMEPSRRSANPKGFDAATLNLFPACDFREVDQGASGFDIELGPASGFNSSSDTADAGVGDQSYLDTDIAGDVELVFTSGDILYRLSADDLGEDASAEAALKDFAERVISNQGSTTGLMDDLTTATLVGGPDVAPCDLVDAQAIANSLGMAAYVVYPIEDYGSRPDVNCTVSAGAIDFVSLSFTTLFDQGCVDPVESLDVAGASVCVGPGTVGIGSEAIADLGDYRVVVFTDREPLSDISSTLLDLMTGVLGNT